MDKIKETVARNIAFHRKAKGLTQKELAAAIDTTNTTISNWEKNVAGVDIESLAKICGVLNVTVAEMFGIDDETLTVVLTPAQKRYLDEYGKLNALGKQKATEYVKDLTAIPRYTDAAIHFSQQTKEEFSEEITVPLRLYNQRASAGLGNYLYDDSDGDYEIINIPQSGVPKGTDFCIKIKGDSMQPLICDGTIVFVRSLPRVDFGKIGVFVIDNEAYCKKIIQERGKILFHSLNKAYADIELTEDMSVVTVGEVIGI